jgi:hypothetical protein
MWSNWEIHRSEQEFVASRKKEILILTKGWSFLEDSAKGMFDCPYSKEAGVPSSYQVANSKGENRTSIAILSKK